MTDGEMDWFYNMQSPIIISLLIISVCSSPHSMCIYFQLVLLCLVSSLYWNSRNKKWSSLKSTWHFFLTHSFMFLRILIELLRKRESSGECLLLLWWCALETAEMAGQHNAGWSSMAPACGSPPLSLVAVLLHPVTCRHLTSDLQGQY